jgi:hypothetical protein
MELQPKPLYGIDIKSEFEKFIEEHGFYVILGRQTKPFHCRCWNEQTREALPTCNICMGTGYEMNFERHKVRDYNVEFDARGMQVTAVGPVITPSRFFYTKIKAAPQDGMLLLNLDWNGLCPVKSGMEVFQVNSVNKMIGKAGKPEYYKIGVDSRPEFIQRFKDVSLSGLKVVDK